VRFSGAPDSLACVGREDDMQGIPFAIETFVAGVGILDWFVFDGEVTLTVLRFIGV